MKVNLPDWCQGGGAEESDKEDEGSKKGGDDVDEDNPPIDEMVGKFVHKKFAGTWFGGTVTATDTCKDLNKKLYVLVCINRRARPNPTLTLGTTSSTRTATRRTSTKMNYCHSWGGNLRRRQSFTSLGESEQSHCSPITQFST